MKHDLQYYNEEAFLAELEIKARMIKLRVSLEIIHKRL